MAYQSRSRQTFAEVAEVGRRLLDAVERGELTARTEGEQQAVRRLEGLVSLAEAAARP